MGEAASDAPLTLADLLPRYPDPDSPTLAADIVSLHEFDILRSETLQKSDDARLYNHQEADVRIMSPITGFDGQLVLHDPGMGKTFIAGTIAEQHKPVLTDKHVLVLVTNQKVAKNFANALAEEIDPSLYQRISKLQLRKGIARVQTNIMRQYYTVDHYNKFFKEVRRNYDPETQALKPEFVEKWSNTIILCDEVHHVKATRQGLVKKTKSAGKGKKSKPKPLPEISVEAIQKVMGADVDLSWLKKGGQTGIRQNFLAFLLFMRSVRNSKKLLMTATPIVNTEEEIAHLMNIILPAEKQVNPSEIRKREGDDLEDYLIPKFVGYITYARAKYNVLRKDMGDHIETEKDDEPGTFEQWGTRVERLDMSAVHFAALRDAMTQGGDNINVKDLNREISVKEEESFAIRSRNASNFVFPYKKSAKSAITFVPGNFTIGDRTIFDVYVRKAGDGTYELTPKGLEMFEGQTDADGNEIHYITDREQLRSISPKFAYILDKFDEVEEGTIKGTTIRRRIPSYVYEPLVHGSGIILLSVIAKMNGYEIFTGTPEKSGHRALPGAKKSGGKTIYRIALILGDTESYKVDQTLHVYNHPQNADGEQILAVLGSQTSGEALSLINARRGFILSPPWHETGITQAVGRIFRIDKSLMYFVPFPGTYYLISGTDRKTLTNQQKEIELYKLAAVYEGERTIDYYIYMLVEVKDKKNRAILRILRKSSITGMVNKELNTHPEDKPGTSEADYQDPQYEIISGDVTVDGTPIPKRPIDRHNFDIYYDYERNPVISDILRVLRQFSSLSLNELHIQLPEYPFKTLLFAVDKMVSDREEFMDSYGFPQYVKCSNDIVFLQSQYEDPDPFSEFYARVKYFSYQEDLEDIYFHAAARLISEFVEKLPKDALGVNRAFSELYDVVKRRIAILYESIIDGSLGVRLSKMQNDTILSRFSGQVFVDDSTNYIYHRIGYVGEKQKNKDKKYALGVEMKKVTERATKEPSKIRVFEPYNDQERRLNKQNGVWRFATDDEDAFAVDTFNIKNRTETDEMGDRLYGILYQLGMDLLYYIPRQFRPEEEAAKTSSEKKGRGKAAGKATAKGKGKGKRKGKVTEEPEVEASEESQTESARKGKSKKDALKGKGASTKTERARLLWELYKDDQDIPFPEYDPDELDRDEAITQLTELLGGRNPKPRYNEKVTGIKLEDISDDMLYFFWYILYKSVNLKITAGKTILEPNTLENWLFEKLKKEKLILYR